MTGQYERSFLKDLYMVGLICLSSLLLVVGLLICLDTKGPQMFMVGVMVVGVGVILMNLVVSCFKGGS